jgi:secreted trypsin-like serine protease
MQLMLQRKIEMNFVGKQFTYEPLPFCAALFFALLTSSLSAFAQQTNFSLKLTPENTLRLRASGVEPRLLQSKAKVSDRVSGGESSECRPNGRQSFASGTADVEILESRTDGVTFTHSATSTAQGGHFRTCAACVSGNCIGLSGNDTSASSVSASRALLTIEFDKSHRKSQYILDVSISGSGRSPTLSLSDGKSNALAAIKDQPNQFLLDSGNSSIYYLASEVSVAAENRGGCCTDTVGNSARIDVRLRKAPLLASRANFEPFIKGGEETSSYLNVGAILIDGRLHCTGTVIGPSTILTAAHCVQGYENQIGKFSFLIGSNIVQPTFGPVKISGYAYPTGEQGFKFNQSSLEDDIALLYLPTPAQIVPALLHLGSPAWEDILSKGTSLIFVGFGYDVIENEKIGVGIKREAAWAINSVENRRVYFSVPGKNTCKGDSGGPAFMILGGKRIQVGITSGGAPDCSTGFETRVDAFQSWLKGRIK